MGAKFVPIILCIIIFSARTLNADQPTNPGQIEKTEENNTGDGQASDTEEVKDVEKVEETKIGDVGQVNTEVKDEVEQDEKTTTDDGQATDSEVKDEVEKVEETITDDAGPVNTENIKDEVEHTVETITDDAGPVNTENAKDEVQKTEENKTDVQATDTEEVKDEVQKTEENKTDVQATDTEEVKDEVEKIEETITDDAGPVYTENVKDEVEQAGETTTDDVGQKTDTEGKDQVEKAEETQTDTAKVKDKVETTSENLVFECELCFKDKDSKQVYDISAHGCKLITLRSEHDWIYSREACEAVGITSCLKCIKNNAFFWDSTTDTCGDFSAIHRNKAEVFIRDIVNCAKVTEAKNLIRKGYSGPPPSGPSSAPDLNVMILTLTTLLFLF